MPSSYTRPTWDEYFLEIMDAVAKRSTCDRGRVATVIARNNQILTTGYSGAPAGLPHCDEVGHEIMEVKNDDGTTSEHCIRTTHAEQNAIMQAARHGVSTEGATIYVGMEPCYTCAKLIINAGIKKVVARKQYHRGARSREVLKEAGVELVVLEEEVEKY
jgi:dCMP deaminase